MTTSEAPNTPTRIGCPACVHRTNLVIDPDCPICHGHGTLRLHPAGLSVATPETIAHTVQIVLETHARQVEETMSLSEDRHTAMCDALDPLVEARVIRAPASEPTASAATEPSEPGTLRAALTELTRDATTLDRELPHAHPYVYREDERPHARGLNILSAAGHPSCTARVTDPPDLLIKTWTTARQVDRTIRSARVLADALTPAIHKRRKATA